MYIIVRFALFYYTLLHFLGSFITPEEIADMFILGMEAYGRYCVHGTQNVTACQMSVEDYERMRKDLLKQYRDQILKLARMV